MSDQRPRAITELLNANTSAFSKLQLRAQQLHAIQSLLPGAAGEPLASQLQVANYQRGQLLLHVSSGSWLQRARFARGQLLQALRQAGLTDLRSLEMVVRPRPAPIATTPPPLYQRTISEQSGTLLHRLGEQLGGELGAAVERLARLSNKSPR